jgi:hypothetical protein
MGVIFVCNDLTMQDGPKFGGETFKMTSLEQTIGLFRNPNIIVVSHWCGTIEHNVLQCSIMVVLLLSVSSLLI